MQDTSADDIDLGLIFNRLARRWYILFGVLLICLAVAIAYSMTATKKYTSTARLISTTNTANSSMNSLHSMTGFATSTSDPAEYYDVILNSKFFVDTLLKHKWRISTLEMDTSLTYSLEEIWQFNSDTTKHNWQQKKYNALYKKLTESGYIQYDRHKKTSVITLSTEFEDPLLAYDVNVFLVEELNNTLINKMNFKASVNRKFVHERLQESIRELEKSENSLKRYLETNYMRGTPAAALEENRLQRKVLLNQEIVTQLNKQYELAKIEEAKDLPQLDIIDPPRIAIEKSKPQRRKIAMLGLAIGLLLGTLTAFAFDLLKEKSIHNSVKQ